MSRSGGTLASIARATGFAVVLSGSVWGCRGGRGTDAATARGAAHSVRASGAGEDSANATHDDGGPVAAPSPAFNPCETSTPCAILPLGDSITAGAGSSDGGGYRVEMFRRAVADGRALTFVGRSRSGPAEVAGLPFPRLHEGHSGYLIDTGPERPGLLPIMADVFAAVAPNIVLLMIGTNDIPWKLDLQNEPKRLGILIDKITSQVPNALLVVAQIGPTAIEERTALVAAYNAGIPQVVEQRAAVGAHVTMVDMFTPFVDTPDYAKALLVDEVHPNDRGHALIGQTWYAAIRSYLPPAP